MPGETDPRREPAFNAPWPVLAMAAALLGAYALQWLVAPDALTLRLAFTPAALAQGRWTTLVTALFLHGGWLHVGMNALGLLAFGAPVARLFGLKLKGGLNFLIFYLLCGVIGNLGYAAWDPDSAHFVIGASGAVSGLMGAASRLVDRRGALGPFRSRTVVFMGLAWLAVNLVIAGLGYSPGAGDAAVAWQAHIAGYAAGLLLIGPFAWFAGADALDER